MIIDGKNVAYTTNTLYCEPLPIVEYKINIGSRACILKVNLDLSLLIGREGDPDQSNASD